MNLHLKYYNPIPLEIHYYLYFIYIKYNLMRDTPFKQTWVKEYLKCEILPLLHKVVKSPFFVCALIGNLVGDIEI